MDNKKDKKQKLHNDENMDEDSNSPPNGIKKKPKIDNNQLLLDKFVKIIDNLDARVAKFRHDAENLKEERDQIKKSLMIAKEHDMLRYLLENERAELFNYIQRVHERLKTVDVFINTVRNLEQEEALREVNDLIEKLMASSDLPGSFKLCQMYWNACSSSDGDQVLIPSSNYHVSNNLVDKKFENVLLGCTLDDQKMIKKRVKSIMLCMCQKNNISAVTK